MSESQDPKSALDKLSGLSSPEERTNYLKEFVTSHFTGYGLLAAVIVGAILFGIFGTIGVFVLPPLLAAGVEGILALFVPDSPVFRDRVDRKKATDRRERVRKHLCEKIKGHNSRHSDENKTHWEVYYRMVSRLDALKEMAADSTSSLSDRDIEKLDETTVNYLRLFYARLTMRERGSTGTNDIEAQIKEIEAEVTFADPRDVRNLERVRDDLQRVLASRARLPAKEMAMKAQLLAMGEAFEELFHRISADPAGGVSEYLNEMSSKLAIEDGLSMASTEADDLAQARARVAQKAKARNRHAETP